MGSQMRLPEPGSRPPSPAITPREGDLPATGAKGDPLLGQEIDGYRILERLGEGGMAVVYAAVHTTTGREVALKLLNIELSFLPHARARFRNEALLGSRLRHPHVAEVLGYGLLGVHPCLVMERLSGEPLSERLRREGRLRPAAAVDLALQALSAISAVHRAGIAHRDLKPENLFLCRGGAAPRVKLLDFGIAKRLCRGEGEAELTRAGVIVGTPHYISPEQARQRPADPRSDLYSFGVVLFEALCGRVPFQGETAAEILSAHLLKEPPRPRSLAPELSPALEAVIMKALQKRPRERYQSADEMAEALRRLPAATSGFEVVPPDHEERTGIAPFLSLPVAPERAGRGSGRLASLMAGGLLFGVFLGFLIALFSRL
jgi:eukaryotic-like serine/threonine-protein kinase